MAIKYTYSWRKEKTPLSDDDKRLIKLMYGNSETIQYISKCFAVTDNDVRRVLGLKIKKNKAKKYVQTEEKKRENLKRMYFGD